MANVLLAEDDGDVAAALSVALEAAGHRVKRATDGAHALTLARREELDVAVLDLLLPKKGGLEVATAVRESTGIPVVLMTGIYRGTSRRDRALKDTGAVAWLEKPFEPAELVRVVEEAVRAYADVSQSAIDPTFDMPTSPGASVDRATMPTPEPLADELAHRERREVERLAARPSRGGKWQGTLTDVPFARLVAELFEEKATGGLLVVREPVKKVVFFEEGLPIFVKSNLLAECLGKVLVKEGLITEDQCRESLRRLQKAKRPQGEILVEMRALDAAALDRGLRLQTETKLLDLFGWPAGKYHWSGHMHAPEGTKRPFDHPLPLLVEGARRRMDPARIRRDLDRAMDRTAALRPAATVAVGAVTLSADERAFVASLDGRHALRDRIAEGDAEARTRLAYALHVAGLFDLGEKARSGSTGRATVPPAPEADGRATIPSDPPRTTAPAPPPVPTRPRSSPTHTSLSDLDAEVERVLEAERRYQKGVSLLAEGRPTLAVEALERAVSLCPDEPEFRLELGAALLASSIRDATLLPQAVAELGEVTKQRPDLAVGWRRLAEALGRSGDRPGAIAAYERALVIDPGSAEARAALAALGSG